MSQSVPYRISSTVFAALQADAAFADAKLFDNPTDPASLQDGERVVFVEDQQDDLNKQPNATEQRTFTLVVGVINRGTTARATADEDMEHVKRVVRAATGQLAVLDVRRLPREGMRKYRLEGIDVGGALIVTEFHFDYLNPRPTRAG